jgi:YD repeat-containing protein
MILLAELSIEKTFLETVGREKMTKAQELGITEFPYKEYDETGALVYEEELDGRWYKWQYDSDGNNVYYESSPGYFIPNIGENFDSSPGYWVRYEYNDMGNRIYQEDRDGRWAKFHYDEAGKCVYFEESSGHWEKYEYDDSGNIAYWALKGGYWLKTIYDENGNWIYWENSDGETRGTKP